METVQKEYHVSEPNIEINPEIKDCPLTVLLKTCSEDSQSGVQITKTKNKYPIIIYAGEGLSLYDKRNNLIDYLVVSADVSTTVILNYTSKDKTWRQFDPSTVTFAYNSEADEINWDSD